MKKIILFGLFSISLLISCQNESSQIEEYSNIYFEILMIREKFQDTTEANPKVRKLLSDYGYTESSFGKYSMELYSNNPQAFTTVIDSVKNRAERQLLEFGRERQRILDSTNNAKSTEQQKKTD